jgi:hypothetical protein
MAAIQVEFQASMIYLPVLPGMAVAPISVLIALVIVLVIPLVQQFICKIFRPIQAAPVIIILVIMLVTISILVTLAQITRVTSLPLVLKIVEIVREQSLLRVLLVGAPPGNFTCYITHKG